MTRQLPTLAATAVVVGLVALLVEVCRVLVSGDVLGTVSLAVLYVGLALIVIGGVLTVASATLPDRNGAPASPTDPAVTS